MNRKQLELITNYLKDLYQPFARSNGLSIYPDSLDDYRVSSVKYIFVYVQGNLLFISHRELPIIFYINSPPNCLDLIAIEIRPGTSFDRSIEEYIQNNFYSQPFKYMEDEEFS